MPTLTGQNIKDTYPYVLWVNGGIDDTTPNQILDGDGTPSALWIAGSRIIVDGSIESLGGDNRGSNVTDLQFSRTTDWMIAKGNNSFLTGIDSSSYGLSSFAAGNNCHATSSYSFAGGIGCISSGNYSWVYGNRSRTGKEYRCTIATNILTVTDSAGTDFTDPQINDFDSIYVYEMTGGSGNEDQVFKILSISSDGSELTILIDGNVTHNEGEVILGKGSSFAFGYLTEAFNLGSHAQGIGVSSTGLGSFGGGFSEETNEGSYNSKSIISSGDGAFAHGYAIFNGTASSGILASGDGSFAIGYSNSVAGLSRKSIKASGLGSFCGGYANVGVMEAAGDGSFCFGTGNSFANGVGSIALGENVIASADNSLATGIDTHSNGIASDAGNEGCIATGRASFARGYLTTSVGIYSSSFGYKTKSTGLSSHIFGQGGESIREGEIVVGGNGDIVNNKYQATLGLVLRCQTSNAAQTSMLNGFNDDTSIIVPEGFTGLYIINIIGTKVNPTTSSDVFSASIKAVIKRDVSGTATIMGFPIIESILVSDSTRLPVISIVSNKLVVKVKGVVSEKWNWTALVQTVETAYPLYVPSPLDTP